MAKESATNYDEMDFQLVDSFPGYNSASDPTKLKAGFLVRGSKNAFKTLRGTLENRPGRKLRGEVDTTEAKVDSSYEWKTSVGTLRPLRVANNKLQVESDIEEADMPLWYDLLETDTLDSPAADLSRFVFDTWWDNDEQTDRLLAVRGDDQIIHWSGGMALVDSVGATVNGAVLTIALNNNGDGSYNVGDIITLNGGSTNCTVRVLTRDGTGILTWEVVSVGSGYSVGSGVATTVVTSSGGVSAGTGVTFNITEIANYSPLVKQGSETWAELGFAITQTVNGSTTSIELAGTEKKIIINDVEYTYFWGEDTTSLFVYPAVTAAQGDVVIQSVFVEPSVDLEGFDFDFIKTISNQVWAGSYSSRVIYLSADETVSGTKGFLNFIDSNTHVAGDPDNVVLDNQAKGIGTKDGKVVLFAGDSDMYLVTPNQNVTYTYTDSDGSARYNFQKIEKKELPGLMAALAHEFIGNRGGELVWLDQQNQLRALGTFATVDSIVLAHLSLAIEDELRADDFTGGHLRSIGDRIYLTAPNSGRDYMYNVRQFLNENGQLVSEKYWDPPQIRGISRFAVIEGVLFGHSNSNPQLYQIWDTNKWKDDEPSEEGTAYSCSVFFAYQCHERPQGLLNVLAYYLEGYMLEGTPLGLNNRLDYQGSKLFQTKTVSANTMTKPPKFFLGTLYPSLGDAALGDNPLGDGIIQEDNDHFLIPKFRAIVEVNQRGCFEYSPEIFSVEEAHWELSKIGSCVMLSSEEADFIKIKA